MSGHAKVPGHRNVETSLTAAPAHAIAHKLGRLRRMTEVAIRDAGDQRLTAEGLAAQLNMQRCPPQPRTAELKRKGLICGSGQRRPNCTSKLVIVWITA